MTGTSDAGEPEVADKTNDKVAAEILAIQKEIAEMDNETIKLKELTASIEDSGAIDSVDVDRRSVYVGNVDYGATPEEIQEHFKACGIINRITILVDKFSGSPKGFAYVEFGDEHNVYNALLLNDSLFRARQLKVIQKRTNVPGMGKDKGEKGKGKGKSFTSFSKGKGKGKPKGYAPWFGQSAGKYDYKGSYKGKGKSSYGGYNKGYSPYY